MQSSKEVHAYGQTHTYQFIGLLASIVALAEYLYYFALVAPSSKAFVSDNLEEDMAFRILVSLIISFQSLFMIFFFTKFREIHKTYMWVGITFVVISLSGWVILVSDYQSRLHHAGFGIFVAGGAVYWVCVFVIGRLKYFEDKETLVWFSAAGTFCVVYVILYLITYQEAWVFEHIGIILLQIVFILFFFYHDPDPFAVYKRESEYEMVPVL